MAKKTNPTREKAPKTPRKFPGKSIAGYSKKTIAERERDKANFPNHSCYEEKIREQAKTKHERRREARRRRRIAVQNGATLDTLRVLGGGPR